MPEVNLVNSLCDFLLYALQNVLHLHAVYPRRESLFSPRHASNSSQRYFLAIRLCLPRERLLFAMARSPFVFC